MISINEVVKLIHQHSRFLISTHKHCDGDGLGAGIALHHILKNLNKKSYFVSLEEPHAKYQFLDPKKEIIQVFQKEKGISFFTPEILFVVDANDYKLVEPFYSVIKQKNIPVCFIDHHPVVHKHCEDIMFIQSEASSTAELIHLLLKKLKASLNEEIASALFTSLVFDTNQFRNIRNSATPFNIASELIPYIQDTASIYDYLFKNLNVDNLGFLKTVDRVQYFYNKTLAFLHITQSYIESFNSDKNQAFDLMDTILDIKSIKHTALLIEDKENNFKISLRSKTKDLLPLAKQLDGGGHKHSAGAFSKKPLAKIKADIISYFKA